MLRSWVHDQLLENRLIAWWWGNLEPHHQPSGFALSEVYGLLHIKCLYFKWFCACAISSKLPLEPQCLKYLQSGSLKKIAYPGLERQAIGGEKGLSSIDIRRWIYQAECTGLQDGKFSQEASKPCTYSEDMVHASLVQLFGEDEDVAWKVNKDVLLRTQAPATNSFQWVTCLMCFFPLLSNSHTHAGR